MTTAAKRLLHQYWLDELGLQDTFPTEGISVVQHGTMEGYSGVIFFKRRNALIISAPEELVPYLSSACSGLSVAEVFLPIKCEALLAAQCERVIGPAWLGEISEQQFSPPHTQSTRELSDADYQTLQAMLDDCTGDEVSHSTIGVNEPHTFGVFIGNDIVAAANFSIRSNILAHVGVLTSPHHRGKGYAKMAISAVVAKALKLELGIQYQTLASNQSSVRGAKSIVFECFAETIAVRIRS